MAIYQNIYQSVQRVLLLSALLCYGACTKEDIEPETTHIAFEIANSDGWNGVSRSAELNNATLATRGFGVFAHYTENSNWASANATSPDFMNNTKVTSSNGGTTWQYTPVKYWPNNAVESRNVSSNYMNITRPELLIVFVILSAVA